MIHSAARHGLGCTRHFAHAWRRGPVRRSSESSLGRKRYCACSFAAGGNLQFGLSGAALSAVIALHLDGSTTLPLDASLEYCAMHV
jgi:hypothetical protein